MSSYRVFPFGCVAVNRAGSPQVFLGGIGYILYGSFRMEVRSQTMKIYKLFPFLLIVIFVLGACGPAAPDTIKIGINAPITGDIPKVGEGRSIPLKCGWRKMAEPLQLVEKIMQWSLSPKTTNPKVNQLRLSIPS